jgi:hypothetical protein
MLWCGAKAAAAKDRWFSKQLGLQANPCWRTNC